ncbi:hypothetical protein [Leptothrix discophora]|uniref:TonB-dependent receptor n=1 Tax=Leptothrix discophora TaxID=89 RepID=A0ABT9FZU7_LEPDI|nr:hypothetical protein [Leptothrix discophora]MDP4299752.1 hypothetical protein [Leptothrix discophora]
MPKPPPHPIRCLGASLLLALTAPDSGAQTPADAPPAVREKPREFLDTLSDTALVADRDAIYRRNGQRREVDLGPGLSAALDVVQPSFLDNPRGTPGQAGGDGRYIQLLSRQPSYGFDLSYERPPTGRTTRVGAQVRLGPAHELYLWQRDRSIEVSDLPQTPLTELRRRDRELGWRWRSDDAPALPATDGAPADAPAPPGWRWVSELGLHAARLAPEPDTRYAPAAQGSMAFWRGRFEPVDGSGLSLMARVGQPIGQQDPAVAPERSARAFEIGADWRWTTPDGLLPAGSRASWRLAPRLGLAGDEEAMTLPAAYQQRIGLELPDGSGRGSVWTQVRRHSLADPADTLGVLGWRRSWTPAPRWGLDTQLEQAVPLAGSTPVRATQAGFRLSTSRFPLASFSTALSAVNSSTTDSAFHESRLTRRLADDWLSSLRVTIERSQPHGSPSQGTTDYKGAFSLGWREPQVRALHLLTRMTWAGREVDAAAENAAAGQADRRARIWLGHASYILDAQQSAMLRVSRRLDRDELRTDAASGSPLLRRTDIWIARWTWEQSRVGDRRWSLSTHVAGRDDAIEGKATGYGAEIGYRMSSRAALAIGYNPRGWSDNEITVEERPRRGVSLRLRFAIEGALARWLDAGRDDAASGQAPLRPSTGLGADPRGRSLVWNGDGGWPALARQLDTPDASPMP